MECCCADDTGIACGAEMTVGGISDELTGVALLLTVFVVRRGVRVEVTELDEHDGASNTDGEPPSPPPGELLVLGTETDAAADAKDAAIDAADGIPPPEPPLNILYQESFSLQNVINTLRTIAQPVVSI